MNQEVNEKLKEFVELFNKCLVESQGTWIMNEKLKGFVELFNNLEKKAKKNGTKD